MLPSGIDFWKGHGTQNDFVVLPDLDDTLELTPAHVVALCDRRCGLGADGVIRLVATSRMPGYANQSEQAPWFMDHRNADGTTAEMCGNGVRVLARHLVDSGLVTEKQFGIATRGGTRAVTTTATGFTVGMGTPTAASEQSQNQVSVGDRSWPAEAVLAPNPHLVVFVDALADAGPLDREPSIEAPAFASGANVEFVAVTGPDAVAFRVFERGVGETRSCGTGAVAVAWAHRRRLGQTGAGKVHIAVAGGRLLVTETANGELLLNGPAEVVAHGEITNHWWKGHR